MIHELIAHHAWFLYTLIALISLSVGSLLNVIIYRLPIMLEREWKQECCELLAIEKPPMQDSLNLFLPQSFCPKCKSPIKAWQNIPLISYIYLWGLCGHCHARISIRYPFIELLTLMLSLFASWHFGLSMHLVFALPFIWILIALFYIDLDKQLLPDGLTIGLLWLGLFANTQGLFTKLNNAVFSAAIAYLSLWSINQVYYLLRKKNGMGNGDFKLFAAFGAWFGWTLLPFLILCASLCGCVIGFISLRIKNKSIETRIAFGPYLCFAGLITMFWGEG